MIAALSALVFAACADEDRATIGFGVTGDDAGAPILVDPPDDGGEPEATSVPTIAMCVSTECPWPFATCFGTLELPPTYACETDLRTDNANCGACGRSCGMVPVDAHLQLICVDAECQGICIDGYLDCNGIVDDGCETDPYADPNNCGSCGLQCPPGVACRGGFCGCPPGQVECDDQCVDLLTDDNHCGACGYKCEEHLPDGGLPTPPPNSGYRCLGGQCHGLACIASGARFWADCNDDLYDDPSDGCEIDVGGSDPRNCGRCGNACAPGEMCMQAPGSGGLFSCRSSPCPPGQTLCDGRCVDVESDPSNCGSCSFVCPRQFEHNEQATCASGRCGYGCTYGFADCNRRSDDGCEIDLFRDPRHCGTCDTQCDNAVGQPCVNGACVTTECDAGVVPR